jgi:hypothetical protein
LCVHKLHIVELHDLYLSQNISKEGEVGKTCSTS